MKSKTIWVMVADAGHARVLAKTGPKGHLAQVDGLDFEHPNPKSSDTVRDSLPRTFDSMGPGRHAITPKSDPHRAEKRDFAKELAHTLDRGLAAKAFDELIIIAPPQMIGDLRPILSDAVKSCLKQELLLDLSKAPVSEIERRLVEVEAE
ncbi:MAG: host attachment protein [Hyphomicrobium sp.]|uniref:host attachment protein n=1 Tax=Hyphomicrobium sp. TaxID=82 RepID=UPI003D0BEE87